MINNEWDRLIKALPDKKYIDICDVSYRPWIRDKSHTFMARFFPLTINYKNGQHLPVELPKSVPYLARGFGYTAAEAISNLSYELEKFKEESDT